MLMLMLVLLMLMRFSALQRAEIAEILLIERVPRLQRRVSVLFNEPKLLKCCTASESVSPSVSFSALQRAEIAEIDRQPPLPAPEPAFQCSSTSRNC